MHLRMRHVTASMRFRFLSNKFSQVITSPHFVIIIYPTRACAKGLSNQFCPSVSLSVCLSSENFWNQHIYWVNNCCTQRWHGNLKKKCMHVYLIETKAVHFSAFRYGQPLGYGGDRTYPDSKHVFTSTSQPGNDATHPLDSWTATFMYTGKWNMVC